MLLLPWTKSRLRVVERKFIFEIHGKHPFIINEIQNIILMLHIQQNYEKSLENHGKCLLS